MLKIYPEKSDYIQLASEYNLIPVYAELRGDLFTTISLFMSLKKLRYQFLLESVVLGEFLSRYSFMGSSDKAFICKDGSVSLVDSNKIVDGGIFENPLDFIRGYFDNVVSYKNPNLPPFVNGIVGYLGYDMAKYFEKIPLTPRDDLRHPDFQLILAERILVYDHLLHKLFLICSPLISEEEGASKTYAKAVEGIESMAEEIEGPRIESCPFRVIPENGKMTFKSNFSKEKFEMSVEKVKKYIYDGDVFQLVLSQRLRLSVEGDAFNLYRSLRVVNPSPYMFYLKLDDVEIIGSSPEVFVQLEEDRVTVRPIAGTRPRGKSPEEDIQLRDDLLSDEKELAEHIMLVDLGRNDVGRVCQGGTVKVDQLMIVEYYSHVMHIVSNVIGKISKEYDAFDLIKATFPAGTLSGAPKIRAMEIISELEPDRRGIYGGMVGYLTFDYNLDSCITIRTIVVKDNIAYLQAGAGIVADSNPEREYYETIHKMKALSKALELAENI
ncbi:MAG: anthranilate synthase component I [Spirochaetota bacterium]|nr:anthranilate synthase component I [Spirochaetota bacterium]